MKSAMAVPMVTDIPNMKSNPLPIEADPIHRVTQKTALLVFFAAEGLDEP